MKEFFERIDVLLTGMDASIASYELKDGILFIGVTGTGKSTSINYLLGHNYTAARDPGTNAEYMSANDDNPAGAPVGHGHNAKTFYSIGYPGPNDTVFLDMSGFYENRSSTYSICTGYLRQLAIQKLGQIRGIAICVPWSDHDVKRHDVDRLITECNEIFKDLGQVFPSLFFLITKASDTLEVRHVITGFEILQTDAEASLREMKQNAMDNQERQTFNERVTEAVNNVFENGEDISSDEQALTRKIQFYKLIIQSNNVFILRPNDAGFRPAGHTSRDEILARLTTHCQTNTVVDKRLLHLQLSNSDPIPRRFNADIAKIAQNGCELMLEKSLIMEKKVMLSEELAEKKSALIELKQTLKSIEDAGTEKESLKKQIESLEQAIRDRVKERGTSNDKESRLSADIDSLRKEINEHNTDDSVIDYPIWPKTVKFERNLNLVLGGVAGAIGLSAAMATICASIPGSPVFLGNAAVFAGTLAQNLGAAAGVTGSITGSAALALLLSIIQKIPHCTFEYKGPYVKAEKESSHGWFLCENKTADSYKISFLSNAAFESSATVGIHIKRKIKFAAKIRLWETEKGGKENLHSEVKAKIGKINDEAAKLKKQLDGYIKRLKEINDIGVDKGFTNRDVYLAKWQGTVNKAEKKISDLIELIKTLETELLDKDKELTSKTSFYLSIVKLNEILPFTNTTIKCFMTKYREFLDPPRPARSNGPGFFPSASHSSSSSSSYHVPPDTYAENTFRR